MLFGVSQTKNLSDHIFAKQPLTSSETTNKKATLSDRFFIKF